jgi:aminoglycoside/choline kinase family phosphotransferase
VTNASRSPESRQWIADALATRWPGAAIERIDQLRGDASARRFWRIFIKADDAAPPPSAVAVDLGPDDLPLYAKALKLVAQPLPEPPYVNIHRFLSSIGVAVPEIYFAPPGARMLLVEDVGTVALFDAASANPARAAELYRLALDELLLFHVEGTRRRDPRCLAFSLAYNERLFAWEMEQFLDCGITLAAPDADPGAIRPELGELAARLGRLSRVFSHRDYHGQNLFVQDGRRIRVLDFQDALMAPPAQDLAVLLTTRDTGRIITPALESDLLSYYWQCSKRRGAEMIDRAELLESYRLCVLQHALKAIGRFAWLERGGKPGYFAYIPRCLEQARRMLASGSDFPRLSAALAA